MSANQLPAPWHAVFPGSWRPYLLDQLNRPYMQQLQRFVQQQRTVNTVYPCATQLFRAFSLTPFSDVSVVILGQDPYHGSGQAEGLSFSVPQGVAVPPSLNNIFKEQMADFGVVQPGHGCLESWARQGVLLLNSVLTVRAGEPGSHRKQGWEQFTDCAIEALSRERQGLVFLLWGKAAGNKQTLIDTSRHLVLTTSHPSPLSAYRGFLGCRHCSSANRYLQDQGKQPIDWQLPS